MISKYLVQGDILCLVLIDTGVPVGQRYCCAACEGLAEPYSALFLFIFLSSCVLKGGEQPLITRRKLLNLGNKELQHTRRFGEEEGGGGGGVVGV